VVFIWNSGNYGNFIYIKNTGEDMTLKINYYQKKGGKKIKLICLQCGKEFERYAYDIEKRNAKYCSLECMHKSRIIKIPARGILYKQYMEDKMSTNQLAIKYSVSHTTTYKWLKKLNIPIRTMPEGVSIAQIGVTHSKEWNEAISRGQNNMKPELKKKRTLAIIRCNRNYGNRSKGGTRKDLGIYVRSRWEANICRYYNFIGNKWLYESKIFYFNDSLLIGKKKIKKGTLSYTPDFYLPELDIWVEVKGYLRDKSKVGLRRFKKYYPKEFSKLGFIIPDKYSRSKANGKMIKFLCEDLGIYFIEIGSYKEIEDKLGGLIPNWE